MELFHFKANPKIQKIFTPFNFRALQLLNNNYHDFDLVKTFYLQQTNSYQSEFLVQRCFDLELDFQRLESIHI